MGDTYRAVAPRTSSSATIGARNAHTGALATFQASAPARTVTGRIQPTIAHVFTDSNGLALSAQARNGAGSGLSSAASDPAAERRSRKTIRGARSFTATWRSRTAPRSTGSDDADSHA